MMLLLLLLPWMLLQSVTGQVHAPTPSHGDPPPIFIPRVPTMMEQEIPTPTHSVVDMTMPFAASTPAALSTSIVLPPHLTEAATTGLTGALPLSASSRKKSSKTSKSAEHTATYHYHHPKSVEAPPDDDLYLLFPNPIVVGARKKTFGKGHNPYYYNSPLYSPVQNPGGGKGYYSSYIATTTPPAPIPSPSMPAPSFLMISQPAPVTPLRQPSMVPITLPSKSYSSKRKQPKRGEQHHDIIRYPDHGIQKSVGAKLDDGTCWCMCCVGIPSCSVTECDVCCAPPV